MTGFNDVVKQAVRTHTHDDEYLRELTEWSGRHGSLAGVPARNIPTPDPAAELPGRLFAGAALAQPADATPAADNAIVLALGTRDDDELARLRAGEATSLVLLTATALGLSSCPITEPLEIEQTREAVRRDVFDSNEFPQMLLRVGWRRPTPTRCRRPHAALCRMSLRGWSVSVRSACQSGQRCRPPQHRSAAGDVLETGVAAALLGTPTRPLPPSPVEDTRDATAVVHHLDAEIVGDPDLDGEFRCARMPHGVADRLAHNGFGVVGQCGVDRRKRSQELHRGMQFGARTGRSPRQAAAAAECARKRRHADRIWRCVFPG